MHPDKIREVWSLRHVGVTNLPCPGTCSRSWKTSQQQVRNPLSVLFELMVNPKVWGKSTIQTLKLVVSFAVEYQSKKKKRR